MKNGAGNNWQCSGFPEHDGKTLIMEIKYTNTKKKLIYKNAGISLKKKAHNT